MGFREEGLCPGRLHSQTLECVEETRMYCTVAARSNFVGARQRLTILRTEPHCSTIRHRRRTTHPTIQVRFLQPNPRFLLRVLRLESVNDIEHRIVNTRWQRPSCTCARGRNCGGRSIDYSGNREFLWIGAGDCNGHADLS